MSQALRKKDDDVRSLPTNNNGDDESHQFDIK